MSEAGSSVEFIRNLPLVNRWSADIDQAIGRYGLAKGMNYSLLDRGIKIQPHMEESTRVVLAKDSALIIGIHPEGIEVPEYLAALSSREKDDISFIGDETVPRFGKNIAKYAIPISPNSSIRNARSLVTASKQLTAGGVVLICPEGGNKDINNWFDGVGLLVEKAGANTHIVFSSVPDAHMDYKRLSRGVSRLLLPETVNVHFSKPQTPDLFNKHDRNATTDELRQQYNEWTKTLPKKI